MPTSGAKEAGTSNLGLTRSHPFHAVPPAVEPYHAAGEWGANEKPLRGRNVPKRALHSLFMRSALPAVAPYLRPVSQGGPGRIRLTVVVQ